MTLYIHSHITKYLPMWTLAFAAFWGCRQARKPEPAVPPAPVPVKVAQPPVLVAVDSVYFRRNYHDFDKMSEQEYDRFCNRDPEPMGDISPHIARQLIKAGIMNGACLRLQPFRLDGYRVNDASLKLHLKSNNGSRAAVRAGFTPAGSEYIVYVNNSRLADSLVLPFQMQEFRLLTADIVPGGFPELVLMRKWYIANGHNYDINIYEVLE